MAKELTPQSYFEIIEACAQPGCPMCRLMADIDRRYLTSIMHETVTDPDIRIKLRRSQGFCHQHTWGLPNAGAGARLGVAIIYHDFLGRIAETLKQGDFKPAGGLSLRRAKENFNRHEPALATSAVVQQLKPEAPCPACLHHDELETISIITLVEMLAKEDERVLSALKASEGLCIPHLRRALELTRHDNAFKQLTAMTLAKISALQTELAEFARKNDHRFLGEALTEQEASSWRRALDFMVGMGS